MITGLEMARSYFFEWGLAFLRQHFPSISKRVAAGIWRGPQIFGADDALSRDHGWGAMFKLVLTELDFRSTAERLTQALHKNAPMAWKGIPTPSDAEIFVTSIDRFFFVIYIRDLWRSMLRERITTSRRPRSAVLGATSAPNG